MRFLGVKLGVRKWARTVHFDRPLPIGVNKKVLGLMKDELGGGIITEFVALRPEAYSYKTEDNAELKKAKGTKKCIINKMLSFSNPLLENLEKGKYIQHSKTIFGLQIYRYAITK